MTGPPIFMHSTYLKHMDCEVGIEENGSFERSIKRSKYAKAAVRIRRNQSRRSPVLLMMCMFMNLCVITSSQRN